MSSPRRRGSPFLVASMILALVEMEIPGQAGNDSKEFNS